MIITKEEAEKEVTPLIFQPALSNRFLLRINSGAFNYDPELLVTQVINYELKTGSWSKDDQALTLEITHEVDAYLGVIEQFAILTKSSLKEIELFSMTGSNEYYSMIRMNGTLQSWSTVGNYASCEVMKVKSVWKVKNLSVVPASKMKKKVKPLSDH